MQFIFKRIKGIIIALSGMFFLLKNEDSIKVQSLFFLLFIGLGYYFEITKNEWIIHIILIGFILSVEALNTVAEKICDIINPKYLDGKMCNICYENGFILKTDCNHELCFNCLLKCSE